MKKLQKHALQPRPKEEPTIIIDEDDYVKVCKQAKEWILLTYSIYTGVLDFQFEEGLITSSHRIMKKLQYKKQRDQKLSEDFKDVDSFVLFYYECRQDLEEAIEYAKLRTDPATPSTSAAI